MVNQEVKNIKPILIIDFGSQYTLLIARRIRELGIYSVIVPCFQHDEIKKHIDESVPAIILSGGPNSVMDDDLSKYKYIFDYKCPKMGICYGQQLIASYFGAKLVQNELREYGPAKIQIVNDNNIFSGYSNIDAEKRVWMSHGDTIIDLPNGFEILAKSKNAPFAFISNEKESIYAMQFHPEVSHTDDGIKLFENFLFDIVGLEKNWNMENFIEQEVKNIKDKIGDDIAICGLSGGVDSAVAALIVAKAIGKKLHCIFVDTAMMRENEAEEIAHIFSDIDLNLHIVDAREIFLNALHGVSDPEEKRKIIGHKFIEVFEDEAQKIGNAKYLVQGTLYPDVIESVSPTGGPSKTIKSHHNVGGLPEDMNFKLIEPLRLLFKDEVRQIGAKLSLDERILYRHPFPGPGLGIRVISDVTKERLDILRKADDIYIKMLREHNLYNEIWQAFAVFLPVKTVGVMGDNRTYENVIALRAVTSFDGMTAEIYKFDYDFIELVSSEIINHVKGVNRVVYDITSKPPGTIEWE